MNDLLRLGLIQCELAWRDPASNVKNLRKILENTEEEADLWLLPEMFLTGFTMDPAGLALNEQESMLIDLQAICRQKRCHLGGSFIWKNQDHYTNRFLLISEQGVEFTYDKRHLFAYANEHEHYQAGEQKDIFILKDWKISPFICYDLRFPEWIRNDGTVDLILFVANWPEVRIDHWKTLLQARAIENQTYVAGVNRIGKDGNGLLYSGDSLCIDANGKILLDLKSENTARVISLSKKALTEFKTKLPFLKDRRP